MHYEGDKMDSKKELIKNTLIIAVGKFSTQVVTFLLLPLYTSRLTTNEYGTYDFICTLVLFLVPFITLLMQESLFRFLIDADSEEQKKRTISQSAIFIICSTVFSSVILFVVLSIIKYELKNYLIIYLIVNIVNGLALSLARGMGNIRLYSLSSFISSFLTIGLNVVFILYFSLGIRGLLIANIIANFITSMYILIKVRINEYISISNLDRNYMMEMIKYSIPLVPNSVSWVIINLSDRLIISTYLGTSFNGIYAIAYKFPTIINTLYGFFYTAWQESASKAIKGEDYNKFYNSIYKTLKRFLVSIMICLISIMPFIFNVFIGSEFIEAYKYIPMLILGVIFSNISGFYGGIFSAYKDTKIMGISTILAAIINLIINILLIRYIGLYAAALSTIIANLIVCIYRKNKIKKYINFDKDTKFIITTIIIGILSIGAYFSNDLKIYICGLIISISYTVYINKNILYLILNIIKK